MLVGAQDHLGVAIGREAVAVRAQDGAQIAEVVDLAVEHHRHVAGLVDHRLRASGWVDDLQPPRRQADRSAHVDARRVRAAVAQDAGHSLHDLGVRLGTGVGMEQPRDSAHPAR